MSPAGAEAVQRRGAPRRLGLGLTWTGDPFDRLLAAHSAARRLALCTVDTTLLRHHQLLAPELAAERGR